MTTLEPGRYITAFPCPVGSATRSLLEFCNRDKFSTMSDKDMAKHITAVRDEAYNIASWPCLGWFLHMPPQIRHAPPKGEYERTVQELCADRSRKVLDLGCMFAHDTRALLQDGVQSEQATAADLMPELLQLGHKLFADDPETSPHLKGMTFHNVDVFKKEDTKKLDTLGGYHAIYIGAFLHLFPQDAQRQIVAMLSTLLSKQPGSVILGGHVGRRPEDPDDALATFTDFSDVRHGSRGLVQGENGAEPTIFLHTPATFAELFAESGTWDDHIEFNQYYIADGDGELMMSNERGRNVRTHLMSFAFRRK